MKRLVSHAEIDAAASVGKRAVRAVVLGHFRAPDVPLGWDLAIFLRGRVVEAEIMVGQQVISAAQDLRAEADHETLTALHQINVQQLKILEELEGIRKRESPG